MKLNVIITSTRPGRNGEPVGKWFYDYAKAHPGAFDEVILSDLAEIGLPLLEQVAVPMVFDYLKDGAFAAPKIVEDSADVMITELGRWAAALKPLRG